MYRDFLLGQRARGHQVEIPENEFDVYDLAALAYLYKRIKEQEVISEAHHIVIDEAQDFGMMAYHVLKFCIYGCTYTVMGDVSQNIHFGFGLNDWEELKELLLPDSMDSFGILKKSYRNTVEISDFATSILHHGQFSSYPVEPIIRHGNPVQVRKLDGRKELIQEAAKTLKGWQRAGYHCPYLPGPGKRPGRCCGTVGICGDYGERPGKGGVWKRHHGAPGGIYQGAGI